MQKASSEENNTVNKLETILDGLYFDTQSPFGANLFDGTKEEYIIKLLTRSIVALCTAWWSTRELLDYLQKRNTFSKGFKFDQSDT